MKLLALLSIFCNCVREESKKIPELCCLRREHKVEFERGEAYLGVLGILGLGYDGGGRDFGYAYALG